jgi:hypothetical protein
MTCVWFLARHRLPARGSVGWVSRDRQGAVGW